jgi:hypothetical protein
MGLRKNVPRMSAEKDETLATVLAWTLFLGAWAAVGAGMALRA